MDLATVWPSLIAVVGTLAGAVTAGTLQARAGQAQRQEARSEARRAERLTAVTELVTALANHRRAMWLREDERLGGAATDVVAELRAASHETRSAVTSPMVRLTVLAPALRDTAAAAEQATYALRDALDRETLADLREQALRAADRLVAEAGELLAAPRQR